MKFTIEQKRLEEILKHICKVVAPQATLPILSHVLIEVGEDLKLTSTNLDQMLVISNDDGTSLETGSILLPAKRLHELVKLETGAITIEQISEKSKVKITTSAGSKYQMHGMDAEANDFPVLDSKKPQTKLQLQANEFSWKVSRVLPAASNDENRYILNSIYLQSHKDELRFVGTDGRILFLDSLAYGSCPECAAAVPSITAKLLCKLIADDCDLPLDIQVATDIIEITWGDYMLRSKLCEGRYPNYKQVFPASYKHAIRIKSDDLAISLSRAATMLTDVTQAGVSLEFDKSLIIKAKSPGIGQAEIPAEIDKGEGACKMTVNPSLLLVALASASCLEAHLSINSDLEPLKITNGSRFQGIIMPMRAS